MGVGAVRHDHEGLARPCLERRHVRERADLGRLHSKTARAIDRLSACEYRQAVGLSKMGLIVAVAKQEALAALRSELSGGSPSGERPPPPKSLIKGLGDDEEEHEYSWGR